mgnify:CR=1 FL=1
MKPELRYQPEFTVTGLLWQGASNEATREVPPLWGRMLAGLPEAKRKPDLWGLMGHPDKYLGKWDDHALYLAGTATEKDAPVPEGWTKWTVPAMTYLVVPCTLKEYGAVFDEVTRSYLPKHGLAMVGAAHERYPDAAHPDRVELYFPVAEGYLFCQSCGMPLTDAAQVATDAHGDADYDYCVYCRKDGTFTSDCTMEQMIDFCVNIEKEQGVIKAGQEAEERARMQRVFPQFKRWKTME